VRSAAFLLALAAAPLAFAKAPAESFCTPQEEVIFACRTGAKLVSVCASKDASPTKGSVEYRFGKPDPKAPLELKLPEAPMLPPKAATGTNVPFAGGGGAWMRFRKGEYAYVAYSGIGKWGPKGETATKAGIVVERGGKAIATLRCKGGDAAGEMGPDWFGKAGIQAGPGEDFDFPD
jgi:hypothetical protein